MARWRRLEISPVVLAEMLRGHPMSALETDFPLDGEIIHAMWDQPRSTIYVVVQSASFDDSPAGRIIPDMDIVATRHVTELSAILDLVRPDS